MRTLVLLVVEALIVWVSFVVGTRLQSADWWLLLNVEGGYTQIFMVTGIVLLFSHWLDLYHASSFDSHSEQAFRMLLVLGLVAFSLAAVELVYRRFLPGRSFLPGAVWGLVVLSVTLFLWRVA